MKPLLIRLPDSLHRRFKMLTVKDGTSMQKVVEGLIGIHILEQQKSQKRKKKTP